MGVMVTLLEIFEWVLEEAVAQAHENAAVRELWARFEEVADFATLDSLQEAGSPFPHFELVTLSVDTG